MHDQTDEQLFPQRGGHSDTPLENSYYITGDNIPR